MFWTGYSFADFGPPSPTAAGRQRTSVGVGAARDQGAQKRSGESCHLCAGGADRGFPAYLDPSNAVAVVVYFFARLAHFIVYASGVPVMRTLMFTVGWTAQIVIYPSILRWI